VVYLKSCVRSYSRRDDDLLHTVIFREATGVTEQRARTRDEKCHKSQVHRVSIKSTCIKSQTMRWQFKLITCTTVLIVTSNHEYGDPCP